MNNIFSRLFLTIVSLMFIQPINTNLFAQNLSEISLDNVQSLTLIEQITFENAIFRDIVFAPDSARLAILVKDVNSVGILNGQLIVLDMQDFMPIQQPHNQMIYGNALAFSPDGTLLAVGSDSGAVSIFDAQTLEPKATFQAGIDSINDLAISPDNQYIGMTFAIPTIATYGDLAFKLISIITGEEIEKHLLPTARDEDETYGGDVYGGAVAFNPNGDTVFFSTRDFSTNNSEIYAVDLEISQKTIVSAGNTTQEKQLIYSNENLYYMMGNQIGALSIKTDEILNYIPFIINEQEKISRLTINPYQPIIAVGITKQIPNPDGTDSKITLWSIRLYHIETGEELVTIDVPRGANSNLVFSPDGRFLVAGGLNDTLRFWGIPAGE